MDRVVLNIITSLKIGKFELYLYSNQVECWAEISFTE